MTVVDTYYFFDESLNEKLGRKTDGHPRTPLKLGQGLTNTTKLSWI